jgi:hypothetical protein
MTETGHKAESLSRGQRVWTGFGPGVISAVSQIDSIVYVTLAEHPDGLYLFRPEQIEIGETNPSG